ncbi:hypothetical protein [Maribacter luteus]|uniref:hypothetical protein n=1 Tax=Maribacter luteus TaxID=2594478 RepID=UPI0024911104|nr:hypothetical protein [Maribacter luteus]
MWRLLYDSIIGIEKVDLFNVSQECALALIHLLDQDDLELKTTLSNIVEHERSNEKDKVKKIYAILENERLMGLLFGDNVLKLKISSNYTKLVQKAPILSSTDNLEHLIKGVVDKIVKEKNSIISPQKFETIKSHVLDLPDSDFMNNIYSIDSSGFSDLRLYHLCETRYFKRIKNGYSKKWNTVVAMKDFRVTKLYYKKHLLMGFSLYRKEDGEQFFWSGQLQEVLESLTRK